MNDINLLIDEDKKFQAGETKTAGKARAAGKIALAVLVLSIAAAVMAAPILYEKALHQQLASIQNRMKSEKFKEAEAVKSRLAAAGQQLEDKKDIIRSIDAQAVPVNELLNAVRNNTPEGCTINEIQYENNTLSLNIRVQEISGAAEFLLNMDRLGNISLSERSSAIKINTNGEYVFHFDIGRKEGE